MKSLDQLKREALESCKLRGHNMGEWNDSIGWGNGKVSICHCLECNMQVAVTTNPDIPVKNISEIEA